EIREVLAVTQHCRTPLDPLAASPLLLSSVGKIDAPEMAAINVATVGIEEDGFAVGSERPLLDFAIPGSHELRSAAARREGVQVLPAVLFGGDEQTIVRSPLKDPTSGVARHIGIGALG